MKPVKLLMSQRIRWRMKMNNLPIAYAIRKRNMQKKAKGGMIENEDQHPHNEPEHGAENKVLAQMDFSKKAQEHEDLEESKMDPGSMNAHHAKTMALRAEPKMAEANLSPGEQESFFSKGGIAKAIMRKKMARGGMYAQGGLASIMGSKHEDDFHDIQMGSDANMKENYAEGGPVDEMGLQDQGMDQDRFLAQHMPEQHMSHITSLDEGDHEEHEDPKLKRKLMLSNIMKGLHSKHYGK